jgi:hypothetical protein
VALKLNGTHQLLVYADGLNLLGDNRDTIKKNLDALTDHSKEICLEVNRKKTKSKMISPHRNVGQNLNIKKANRSFRNVVKFRWLGTRIKNQNLVHGVNKSKFNPGNASYSSLQKLLFSRTKSVNAERKPDVSETCSVSIISVNLRP